MKRMKSALRNIRWLGAFILVAMATPVFADNGPTNIVLYNPIAGQSFLTVVQNVISFMFYDIAVPLCTIMALVGGFQLMTSAGDPEKSSRGKKTLLYAAIGFGIVLIASGIASLLQSILNNT